MSARIAKKPDPVAEAREDLREPELEERPRPEEPPRGRRDRVLLRGGRDERGGLRAHARLSLEARRAIRELRRVGGSTGCVHRARCGSAVFARPSWPPSSPASSWPPSSSWPSSWPAFFLAFFFAGPFAARSRSSSMRFLERDRGRVDAPRDRRVRGAVGDVGTEPAVEHPDRRPGVGARRRARRAAASCAGRAAASAGRRSPRPLRA